MDPLRLQREFAFPHGYTDFWSEECDVPPTSIDELGHVTAAHYPVMFESAAYHFIDHLLGRTAPDFVTAQMHLFFRREVLLARAPVRIHVTLENPTESSIDLAMVMVDAEGTACAMATNHYVAWDRESRKRRRLTDAEFSAFGVTP